MQRSTSLPNIEQQLNRSTSDEFLDSSDDLSGSMASITHSGFVTPVGELESNSELDNSLQLTDEQLRAQFREQLRAELAIDEPAMKLNLEQVETAIKKAMEESDKDNNNNETLTYTSTSSSDEDNNNAQALTSILPNFEEISKGYAKLITGELKDKKVALVDDIKNSQRRIQIKKMDRILEEFGLAQISDSDKSHLFLKCTQEWLEEIKEEYQYLPAEGGWLNGGSFIIKNAYQLIFGAKTPQARAELNNIDTVPSLERYTKYREEAKERLKEIGNQIAPDIMKGPSEMHQKSKAKAEIKEIGNQIAPDIMKGPSEMHQKSKAKAEIKEIGNQIAPDIMKGPAVVAWKKNITAVNTQLVSLMNNNNSLFKQTGVETKVTKEVVVDGNQEVIKQNVRKR